MEGGRPGDEARHDIDLGVDNSNTWGTHSPTPTWVISGVHCTSVPLTLQYCDVSESHMKSGSGQLRFYMVNMRYPLQFGLLRGGRYYRMVC